MCDYIVVPERNCYPLQAKTSFEQAAVAEPLAIGVYASRRVANLQGACVGILGAGPIGRSTLEGTRIGRAGTVYVTDKIEARCAAAEKAGAAWTGNPTQSDVVRDILTRTATRDRQTGSTPNPEWGHGKVNGAAALRNTPAG